MRSSQGKSVSDGVVARAKLFYKIAAAHALKKSIILADTKLEFGLTSPSSSSSSSTSSTDATIVLADEILTPDSSRYGIN